MAGVNPGPSGPPGPLGPPGPEQLPIPPDMELDGPPGVQNTPNMVAEPVVQALVMQGDAIRALVQQMGIVFERLGAGGSDAGVGSTSGGSKKFRLLEEKHFSRVEKFNGEREGRVRFRSWIFDLVTVIGTLDKQLGGVLEDLLKRGAVDAAGKEIHAEKWEAAQDGSLDQDIYKKYSGELYGLLVQLTEGDAKEILRGLADRGKSDGFLAMLVLSKRFDSKTSASLLSEFLEVVGPGKIKGADDLEGGVDRWEAKLSAVKK